MAIDLLAEEPIDLLAEEPDAQSFEDLSEEDQKKSLALAKQKIAEQYPNMPEWLRDAVLQLTPKNESPLMGSVARGFSDVTNKIPAAAGGILQGASLPIRGVASAIPSDFTQKLANSPDLSNLFQKPESEGDQYFNMAGQLAGGGGILGKMFQGIKGASALVKVPKALQTPVSLAGTGALATQGGAKERALGAGEALALGGAANVATKAAKKVTEKLPAFMRGLTNKSTTESLAEAAQKPHDILQSTADEQYNQVRQAIKKRDIKTSINSEYLDKIAEILPKTRASRQLIEKAKSGDYEAFHDLQSHLYKKGTKGLSSDDIALENQGEEILELRDKINDDLEKQLIREGHIDIAHVLKQGKKTYAKLKDTYFHKNLPKGIGKLVHSETRLVPENPEKLFTQNSVPMKRFLEQHPEVAKHTQGIKEKEKAMKELNKIFIGTGVGGATLSGGKLLYDLFK